MGAAEPGVGQQAPHLFVAGDQPRLVAGRGTDLVGRTLGLQGPEPGSGLQRACLLERQLREGWHVSLPCIPSYVHLSLDNTTTILQSKQEERRDSMSAGSPPSSARRPEGEAEARPAS